jgi:hypothetical protein
VLTIEYSEVLAYPAAAVFAILTDVEARPAWQTSLLEVRAEPAGPLMTGSRLVETRKYMGYKTRTTLIVSVYEPGRQLTLETAPDAPALVRESYQIETLSDQSCRLVYHTEADGVPKMFEALARKSQERELPQNIERLKTLLAKK